jgi:DNA polymerase-1
MANDPTLLEAFEKGEDPHAVTAAEVLGIPFEDVTSDHRRVAKMVNYGVLYGMSDYGLAERTGLPSADASGFIQRYFQRFGTVKAFQDRVIGKAEDDGYAETLLGRRRYFPEIRSHLYAVRQAAIRATINAPIQGSASDIVKIAMIQVSAFLEREAPSVHMLLQVHDELLFEGPEDELRRVAPDLVDIMDSAIDMKARLHVDLKMGPNWEDMKPFILPTAAPLATPAHQPSAVSSQQSVVSSQQSQAADS